MFIQDSLHNVYVDSLYQRSSDSLHRASTDSLHDTNPGAPLTDGKHSNNPIVVTDESHKIHPDSLGAVPPVPEKYQGEAYGDSLRLAATGKSRSQTQGADSTQSAAMKADSLRRPRIADSVRGADNVKAGGSRRAADSVRTAALKTDSLRKPTPGKEKDSVRDKLRDNALVKVKDSVKAVVPVYDPRTAIRGRAQASDTASTASISDTSIRYIKGYHNVRIFSDSLQAVADSMYYSGKDSIFRLYKEPIAWGNGNFQVTGDTMFMYTKNKKADRLYVFENGLAINKIGPNFYNQIKGTTINAYFKDGVMDFMRSKGNAESIYYVQNDKKAFTGVNKAHADIIDMIFVNKELNRVVLRNDAEGSMIPFKKVNFDEMRLRGFKWQEEKRPKSKFELFQDVKAKTDKDEKAKESDQ